MNGDFARFEDGIRMCGVDLNDHRKGLLLMLAEGWVDDFRQNLFSSIFPGLPP